MKVATKPTHRSIVFKPLDEVPPAARNPKAHDLPSIVASIRRFGFADAVVVDQRTGRLVSGHGRIDALRAMRKDGEPAPDGVLVVDDVWHVPVQVGWASKDDTEAEAFVVAANRLVERGGWDQPGLEAVLADLAKHGALDGIGYSSEEIESVLNEVKAAVLPELPFGDRQPFQQMTFTLSDAQAEVVRRALAKAAGEPDGSGNQNRNGNALANVCRAFLAVP